MINGELLVNLQCQVRLGSSSSWDVHPSPELLHVPGQCQLQHQTELSNKWTENGIFSAISLLSFCFSKELMVQKQEAATS